MSIIPFAVFYGLMWLITLLPWRVMYAFSDFVYFIIYHGIHYRKGIALTNLRNAFPEKTEKEIRTIAKKFYHHFCDQFLESMAIIHMKHEEFKRRMTFKNLELLEEHFNNGRHVIAVIDHYGNFEWATNLPLYSPYKVCAVYKPLYDKHFDRLYIRLREKAGMETIPMANTLRRMIEMKKEEHPSLTYFLTDQRPVRKNIRYWTNFLNQDTPVLLGTERIAKKLGHAVLFFHVRKLKRGYYETEITTLVDDPNKTEPYEITESHVQFLEKIIQEKPEHWLWTHRRWRHRVENFKKWADEHNILDQVTFNI